MSQAVCAICLTPIVKPSRWKVSGTEVFHEACVVAYGTVDSIGQKQQKQIAEMRGEIERLRYEMRSERQLAKDEREITRRIASERDRIYDDLGAALSDARSYRVRMEEARRERDEATAARDAARREAQLHQTIQGSAAPAATAPIPATPEVAKDDRDSTEVRFSLLELD